MLKRFDPRGLLCWLLTCVLILSGTADALSPPVPSLPDPNEQIFTEDILVEDVITEDVVTEDLFTEFITEEVYLEELIVAEDEIAELLLEEETIEEVLLCRTIYVPQENLAEFAANSQTARLFGDDVDIAPLLAKFAVGTGVILTVTVLSISGFSGPVASIVASAAERSLQFAAGGAVMGSLLGAFTGAADSIDATGRTSAVIGFAAATAGLILSIVSLIATVPTGGGSALTAAAGVKLVVAGVSVLAASAGTAAAGYNAVKTFTSTDAADIDWANIDWERAGVSAAQRAINYGAEGYMWGAMIGAVYGGAEGYEYYYKYGAPYTAYETRIDQTPRKNGHWSGEKGESDFILDKPIEWQDTQVTRVTYRNGIPDFSPYQEAQVKIPQMTSERYSPGGNFEQADEVLAEYWTRIGRDNATWTARQVANYRANNGLTWHEMSNMETMQLVPTDIHQAFSHTGGVAECKAMIGQMGVNEFG